jgi:PIN domain nuclease of toxin-antitoxin system
VKLLLDTQAFILFTGDPGALPAKARAAVEDPENQLLLSLASPWEMQIKVGLGKLRLQKPPGELVRFEADRGAVTLLPISLAHIDELSHLPPLHRDPFDRMLIAQARCEGLTLVSGDASIRLYPVDWLWD